MIQRQILEEMKKNLFGGFTYIIYGARQTWKTTLVKELVKDFNYLYLSGDDASVVQDFTHTSLQQLQIMAYKNEIIVIDEAQKINNIGNILKVFHDQIPQVQVIATWSSSLELANSVKEPLTWRIKERMLFPLSLWEIADYQWLYETQKSLESIMIYGSYPAIFLSKDGKQLSSLAWSYLYKDTLYWRIIKRIDVINPLLQALAFQIGKEIKYSELWQIIWVDPETVKSYISLLEQAFIIYTLSSYSNNPRNELKKSKKIYFRDLGIRNALIRNYNPLHARNDVWELRENLVINERIKHLHYNWQSHLTESFFRRSTSQQEIDYLEKSSTWISAREIKRNTNKKIKLPSLFKDNYPNANFEIINKENIRNFLGYKL